MNLYLVKGLIETHRYMVDGFERFEDLKLVRATNAHFAGEKYIKHWADKDDPYYKSYYAQVLDISEVIE